ncbi:MAG: beta strand repeat-containing protein, partial [Ferruginibacter sp.]
SVLLVFSQTNPAPQAVPYTQNFAAFTGTGSSYPAGWQGWTITGSTAATFPTGAPAADQVLATGATAQNSAVSAFVGDAVGKIAFLCTSSALKSIVLAVNTTGINTVQVAYTAATQRQQIANRIGAMGLQYRVGTSGTFTNVTGSEYQNIGGVDNITGTGSLNTQSIVVTLPSACDNQAVVQLRWVYREVSGASNRPGFSITNVNVTAGTPVTPASVTAGTLVNFGNVTVGTNSTAQTVNITGANLTGAPGNLTITAPSTNFQVSSNNIAWGPTATIAYNSATLGTTPFYVRFTPQSTGALSGNITITGGGLSAAVNVAAAGTGIPSVSPTLTNTSLAPFVNTCLNVTAGPNSFTLSGSNLNTDELQIDPLPGYTFATSAGGTYASTLVLTQSGGSYSQIIFVKFTPTAVQSYSGNILITGGGATAINVAAVGAGVNSAPSVTTGSASAITTTTATLAGSIPSIGCSSISGYGIEYSLVNGFASGNGTSIASNNLSAGSFAVALNGLTASTTYYYKAYATNDAGTNYGTQQSFTTAAPPPPVVTVTTPSAFGTLCLNVVSAASSIDITGANLTTANLVVGPLAGFSFATTAAGTFTSSLSLTQTGGTFTQTVYVKFTPTAAQVYNGNIPITGGGLTNATNVAVTGTGINTAPSIAATDSLVTNPNTAILTGTVTDNGCSAVTSYGVVYSSIPGFRIDAGTRIFASNLGANGKFTATVIGLVPFTQYYFRTFATNAGGTTYSDEKAFTTQRIPLALTVYNSPIQLGGTLRFSLNNVVKGNYSIRLIGQGGQLIFQKNFLIQVNFLDNSFKIPSTIQRGLYTLQVITQGFSTETSFMIL